MAGSIEFDAIGSTFVVAQSGNSWRRRWNIVGLEAGPSIPDLIDEAYDLIPDPGSAAPSPIANMFVRESSIDRIWCDPQNDTPVQTWRAQGTLTYTTPTRQGGVIGTPDDNGPGLNFSSVSTVEEFETDLDRSGVQITTTFDNVTMAHNARTFRIGRSFDFRRIEASNPRARQTVHEGTLNASLWNGFAAETVLLQTMDWDTDDDGASYIVTYNFVVRPTWQFRAVHEDPFFPGHPLPGATGGAVATVDLIPTSDFGLLSITLPT